ncbi:hypothetical protein HPP92_026529 [Vanilla planifolia]|uniref:Remorin n=1 Tax=Vanilla planifolia TaxID=51239 RepID=A0A835U702_VANPL|nr:hypothetical protein HPP92_026529 [Vanilla planifolia]
MGEEEAKNVEVEGSPEVTAEVPPPTSTESSKDTAEEKAAITPATEEKANDLETLVVVEKIVDLPPTKKNSGGSIDRDAVLANVENEKKMSLIKAWEDSEKVKAENKAAKKMSGILSWENSRTASIQAEMKKIEEALEKKKAEYAEKIKNKIATVHKEAEEKRAIAEAKSVLKRF